MAEATARLTDRTGLDLPKRLTVRVLTDGKAGDEQPCVAIAEALGLRPDLRHVYPRRPFTWLMPRGPIDPAEAPDRPGSPIGPPWPDIALASGRRAVPYLRALKRAAGDRTLTVFLKDPRVGPEVADLIWAPSYDAIRGPNVLTTLTSPHRLSAEQLSRLRADPDPRIAVLPSPRAAVLVGGPGRRTRFDGADIRRLLDALTRLAASGTSLAVSTSRRTPAPLVRALRDLVAIAGGFLWNGEGENPHLAILALADMVVVTADSVNMLSEAVATGAPVLAFELPGAARRHRLLLAGLYEAGVTRPFDGQPERFTYEPLDSTPLIAQAIEGRLARHLKGRGPA